MNEFARFETLSFDCYGTLIDWETGIRNHLGPWAQRNGLTLNDVISEFGKLETHIQTRHPQMPYPQVLAAVLQQIGDASEEESTNFGNSIGDWPAFPDSVEGLRRLQERYRLAILSNVDRASFARSSHHLGVEFDVVVTAEDVGAYKPNRQNFLALFDRLELGDRSNLLHVAQSLYHDHEPALALGLQTVWINRPSAGATPPPATGITPTWTFPSLAAFAEAVFDDG